MLATKQPGSAIGERGKHAEMDHPVDKLRYFKSGIGASPFLLPVNLTAPQANSRLPHGLLRLHVHPSLIVLPLSFCVARFSVTYASTPSNPASLYCRHPRRNNSEKKTNCSVAALTTSCVFLIIHHIDFFLLVFRLFFIRCLHFSNVCVLCCKLGYILNLL